MKELLVYVADADALGFMRAVLQRPHALGTRAITFDIERHPQRDAGMVHSGAELARMKKDQFVEGLRLVPELVSAVIADSRKRGVRSSFRQAAPAQVYRQPRRSG